MRVTMLMSPTVIVEPSKEEREAALTVFYRDMVTREEALATHDGTVNGEPICIIVARGSDAVTLMEGIRQAMDEESEDGDDE